MLSDVKILRFARVINIQGASILDEIEYQLSIDDKKEYKAYDYGTYRKRVLMIIVKIYLLISVNYLLYANYSSKSFKPILYNQELLAIAQENQ